jgi:hypothetical protein
VEAVPNGLASAYKFFNEEVEAVPNGLASAYKFFSEEVEAVSFSWLPK